MKDTKQYVLRVVSVGFLVLTMYSILLFGLRLVPRFWLQAFCYPYALHYHTPDIDTASLIPEYEDDPNIIWPSHVSAYVPEEILYQGLGLWDTLMTSQSPPDVHRIGDDTIIHFDRTLGLFVLSEIESGSKEQQTEWRQVNITYAGPNGIGSEPNENFGRFHDPIGIPIPGKDMSWSSIIVYEKKDRRFFQIDFLEKKIHKGTPLPNHLDILPVDVFADNNFPRGIYLRWTPPLLRLNPPLQTQAQVKVPEKMHTYDVNFLPVLDREGTINRLDFDTLKLTDKLGTLPSPSYGFLDPSYTSVDQVLGYQIRPFVVDGDYRGIFTGAISRDADAMGLAAFDPNGTPIGQKDFDLRGASAGIPTGPLILCMRFCLENLHPPLPAVLSHITYERIPPLAGYQAIYLLPNTLAASLSRESPSSSSNSDEKFLERSFLFLGMISPSILLSLFLAWRVVRDARLLGVSQQVRTCWIVGTLSFGLPVWITYRLTRPGIWMVSCGNCGKLRRPDWETCQHCQSGWDVPELKPPGWRVYDKKKTL